MDQRRVTVRATTPAGGPASLLPQSPLSYRHLAVAAAAASTAGSEQKRKTGKKHPGKAILAGESCRVSDPCVNTYILKKPPCTACEHAPSTMSTYTALVRLLDVSHDVDVSDRLMSVFV